MSALTQEKKKSYVSKKSLYPTSTVELIAEVGGEIKSTKKLLKYSIVHYNAVALENTLCFCYAPICIYTNISEFQENFAGYRYIFLKKVDGSRIWNGFYMVNKLRFCLKTRKLRGPVAKVYNIMSGDCGRSRRA